MAEFERASMHDGSLFFALAEDLKTPLIRIAYQAELSEAEDIRTTAVDALKLLDAYLLSTAAQKSFELEPVNPGAILVDTAHELSAHAKRYDCELQVHANAMPATVLVHRQALQTALSAIGRVFIEAQSVLGGTRQIELASYRTTAGVAVGIFQDKDSNSINAQLLSRARSHLGIAARPFAGLASGAAAQLFIAEQLLLGMQAPLRAAHRGNMSGLAADFLSSDQLQLV
jgi:hypothetical protein